jgi:general secretion pathway protein K
VIRRAAPNRQRGIALVLVIWVAVLLTVGRAIYEVYRVGNPVEAWRRDGTPYEWRFDGVPVRVEMRDESAKIDINTANDLLLRGLFLSVGLPDDEAASLVDAVLDWRDADSLKRPNGAEEADYRAAGLAYKPANAPFQAIEEIQLVLGMRPEIYRRIAPLITVFSRQTGVNPQLATREVLMAIPGLTSDVVDDYITRREAARDQNLPLPILPQAGIYTSGGTLVMSMRSEARLDDGTVFAREAVAVLRPTPRRAVTFVAWRESTAGAATASNPAAAQGAADAR